MVAWLADVEQSANRFYWDCSVYFKDPNLALFLEKLSVDEAFHLQVIRTVETILEDQGAVSPFSVALPDELKFGVMELFQTNQAKIGENTLTLDSLYDCLLRTEFSEWNDFFVYVVESVLKNRSDLHPILSKIQKHLTSLEHFFGSDQELRRYYDGIVRLPRIWNYKILIVDDDAPMRTLLSALLSRKYLLIETAADGREALQMVSDHYYDVIVTDVDMPNMTGIQLFQELVARKLFNSTSIVFMTGTVDHDSFFDKENVPFVRKPFSTDQIVKSVDNIILHSG